MPCCWPVTHANRRSVFPSFCGCFWCGFLEGQLLMDNQLAVQISHDPMHLPHTSPERPTSLPPPPKFLAQAVNKATDTPSHFARLHFQNKIFWQFFFLASSVSETFHAFATKQPWNCCNQTSREGCQLLKPFAGKCNTRGKANTRLSLFSTNLIEHKHINKVCAPVQTLSWVGNDVDVHGAASQHKIGDSIRFAEHDTQEYGFHAQHTNQRGLSSEWWSSKHLWTFGDKEHSSRRKLESEMMLCKCWWCPTGWVGTLRITMNLSRMWKQTVAPGLVGLVVVHSSPQASPARFSCQKRFHTHGSSPASPSQCKFPVSSSA